MSTAVEQILAALGTLAGAVPAASFYRSRESAIARAEGTAIVLEPEEEGSQLRSSAGPVSVQDFVALFIIMARADTAGATADQVADAVIEPLHRLVMQDRTLGGKCALIQYQGRKWAFEVADLTAVTVEIRYLVRYQTLAADLAQLN